MFALIRSPLKIMIFPANHYRYACIENSFTLDRTSVAISSPTCAAKVDCGVK